MDKERKIDWNDATTLRFFSGLECNNLLHAAFFDEESEPYKYDLRLIRILYYEGFSDREIQALIGIFGYRGLLFYRGYFTQMSVIRSTIKSMERY